MTTTRPQLPAPDNPRGWDAICHTQIHALFDWAHNRVDPYVRENLIDMEASLSSRLHPRNLAGDLLHILAWLDNLVIGPQRPWTPLPSTRRREARFARSVFGPRDLETFLDTTFDHLQTALSRRKGRVFAADRVRNARACFAPVHAEALRRLTDGPKLTQLLSGPGGYAIVPGMWAISALLIGDRRREREEVLHEMAVRASRVFKADVQPVGLSSPRTTRIITAVLLSCMGAAILPTATYNLIDVARVYWRHLDAIEHLILYGDLPADDLDDEEEEDEDDIDWDLPLYDPLYPDEEEPEEEPEDEPEPRPGLLAIVKALDTGEPFVFSTA